MIKIISECQSYRLPLQFYEQATMYCLLLTADLRLLTEIVVISLGELVARTGVEPVISALRGRRPKPLDERACFLVNH